MILKVIGLIICIFYLIFAVLGLAFSIEKGTNKENSIFMLIFLYISVVVNLLVQFLMYID